MPGSVCVVASINVDLVATVPHLPRPGETVGDGRFAVHEGGKGANQAVAAARAGARVELIGAVGGDEHGRHARAALERDGIGLDRLRVDAAQPTGVALIAVGPRGENQIAVAPGANANLSLGEADLAVIAAADVVLVTHEVPAGVVIDSLRAAHDASVRAILNPAPARPLSAELLHLGPILTPNEHELIVAIGNDVTEIALDELASRNAGPVIVTQGAAGALLADGSRRERFPGFAPPAVVDSTGAGDTFNGVLAAWIAGGAALPDAIRAANAAAAVSIGAAGAREGMPTREAIEAFLDG
jgi:ribokinase